MSDVRKYDLLTAAEVAERLGVKPGTILGWYRMGRIPARRLSHKVLRFNLDDVVTALENHLLRKGIAPADADRICRSYQGTQSGEGGGR
jgi:excisionase family DNA binding protein